MTYLFYPRNPKEFETELVSCLIAIGAQVRMIKMAEQDERAESFVSSPAFRPPESCPPTLVRIQLILLCWCLVDGSARRKEALYIQPTAPCNLVYQTGDEKGES